MANSLVKLALSPTVILPGLSMSNTESHIDGNQTLFTKERLIEDLKASGVREGDLLSLWVSLRAVGWIEGGAKTLLEALLEVVGPTGTLVTQAYIPAYPLPLSPENAAKLSNEKSPSYTGKMSNVMIEHPRMVRSKHPLHRFAAIGPLAEELCYKHTPESPAYDVLSRMRLFNGKALRIGKDVIYGLAIGTGHASQEILNLRWKKFPEYGINYRDESGAVKLFRINWSGGCGIGFEKFIPFYEERGALLSKGMVGQADTLLIDINKAMSIEMDILSKNPRFFFCSNPWCVSCRTAWEFSPKNLQYYMITWISPLAHKLKLAPLLNRIRGKHR